MTPAMGGGQRRIRAGHGRRAARTRGGRAPAAWAVAAQASQGLTAFLILAVAARTLSLPELGSLSILYGLLVVCGALTTGFVGDSLTVLDRFDPGTRGGLVGWLVVLGVGCSLIVPPAAWAAGLIGPPELGALAAAVATYLVKDVLRRTLMARLHFTGIVFADLMVLPVAGGVLAGGHAVDGDGGLGLFLAALAVGQLAGIVVAWLMLPVQERSRASLRGARLRRIAGFGAWRAAQQALRPTLLTGLRTAVVLVLSLEAAGLLEVARVYAAPAMQIVAGISSYLFASFAGNRAAPMATLLRQADRGVAALTLITLTGSVAALLLLPVAGPIVTGRSPDAWAVAAWLAYAGATAAATPYGTLAAVRAGSLRVFLIRLADTVAALLAGAAVLAVAGSASPLPFAAAAAALAGGLALRRFLLVPLLATDGEADRAGAAAAAKWVHQ